MPKIIDSKSQFLNGPNSRGKEFSFSVSVMLQLISGFRKLHFIGPAITVFGSARFQVNHKYYQWAYEIGHEISKLGFTTMTGGGPGIMEAANRGAYENGGHSVGCSIVLPQEQTTNPYMHKYIEFDHFFVRKVLLLKYSYAFIVMPGGYGTLDELFETLTLIQTAIIQDFPVVIYGKEFYADVQNMIGNMIKEKTISPKDKELILFTDNTKNGIDHIKKYISSNYEVIDKKTKPLWWLGESRK